jgi:hypothetical protein
LRHGQTERLRCFESTISGDLPRLLDPRSAGSTTH